MFGYAVKHHARKADMEIPNDADLTPLTLASKLGRNEIFKEIIELQSRVSISSCHKIYEVRVCDLKVVKFLRKA